MRTNCLGLLALGILLSGCTSIDTAPTTEEKLALAPTGKLRVGLYLGNPLFVVRDAASGEMKGVGFDLGKELAQRMRVPFEPVVYPSIGALVDNAKSGQWDVAFFAATPARAKNMDFTTPHLEVEYGYLVPSGSSISTLADVDRPGIRIAVSEKSQSDAILSRSLKQAMVVRAAGLAAGRELVRSGAAEAFATVKPSLFEMSNQWPGSRVLDGRFATDHIAMAVPKGRDAGVAYARKFIEDAKSEGLVKAAVEKAGVRGAVVAPPQ